MKVLVELDAGLLQLVDAEASAAGAGAGVPRLKVVRELIVEGLRARAAGRGEEFPEVEAWTPSAPTCGRASLTPGYTPCRRPPHDEGPCAHELSREVIDATYEAGAISVSLYMKGAEIISARVNDGTEAVILSRPVRTAHEALTTPDVIDLLYHKKAESKSVSSIASFAQTVAEERMRDRTAKPV